MVAAGFGISEEAGSLALVVKMGRVLMLGPVVLITGFLYRKSRSVSQEGPPLKGSFPIPLFIIGFFVMSILSSYGILPEQILLVIGKTGKLLLNIAMAGIGMRILFSALFHQGPRILGAEIALAAVQGL